MVDWWQDMYAFLAGLDIGPRYPDTVQNLQLINVIQPAFESTTRLRLVRRLSAPDYKQDVPTYIDVSALAAPRLG